MFGPLASWVKTIFLCWWLAVSVVWAPISRSVAAGPSPRMHSAIPLFINWLMLFFCLCFCPLQPLYTYVVNSYLSWRTFHADTSILWVNILWSSQLEICPAFCVSAHIKYIFCTLGLMGMYRWATPAMLFRNWTDTGLVIWLLLIRRCISVVQ